MQEIIQYWSGCGQRTKIKASQCNHHQLTVAFCPCGQALSTPSAHLVAVGCLHLCIFCKTCVKKGMESVTQKLINLNNLVFPPLATK